MHLNTDSINSLQYQLIVLTVPQCSLLTVWVTRCHGGDPCDPDQHSIISEGQRSISFVPGKHDSLLCDNYKIINGQYMCSSIFFQKL